MMRFSTLLLGSVLLVACALPTSAQDPTRSSVVKIYTVTQEPDPASPWKKGAPSHVSGTGVVIEGKRILTNAHVVAYALEILVQPEHSSEKLVATVVASAPGIDLAVLKLEDESFFDDHRPLAGNESTPRIQDTVTVYGYPQGGATLSITRGIVSRIEYSDYWFGTKGLRVQIDAAINHGNSGGPVMVGAKMIGLAFMILSQADNIGYVIPYEEIALFLKDIADGHYDGKPVLLDATHPLVNAAIRGKVGLDKKSTGVEVAWPGPAGPDGAYPLRRGDVLTRIGDHAIDNTGVVQFAGIGLVDFHYVVQRIARDNTARLTILRDGRESQVDVPVGPERDRWLVPQLQLSGGEPSYFIYGPLVFTEATRGAVANLLGSAGFAPYLALRSSPLVTRFGDRPAFEGERLVYILEPPFAHRIYQGYRGGPYRVVDEVNGIRVRNLKHLVEILRDADGEFVDLTVQTNQHGRVVFRREEALRATEEILASNGIRDQCSADLIKVWQGKGK